MCGIKGGKGGTGGKGEILSKPLAEAGAGKYTELKGVKEAQAVKERYCPELSRRRERGKLTQKNSAPKCAVQKAYLFVLITP